MRSYTYRDAILPFDINQVIMSKRRKVVSTVNIGSWSENTSFTPGKTAVQWAGGVKPVQALRTECPAGKRNVDPYECADCTPGADRHCLAVALPPLSHVSIHTPGTFTNEKGFTQCLKCPETSYSDGFGASKCKRRVRLWLLPRLSYYNAHKVTLSTVIVCV